LRTQGTSTVLFFLKKSTARSPQGEHRANRTM
jgi:hypothetical protein